MRTLRSLRATSMRMPSSTPLRPSFQALVTRIEYCSIVSGSVVGTISTAIWLPFAFSNAVSLSSSALRCVASSVLVRSVTRAASLGTATSACAEAHAKKTSSTATAQRNMANRDRVARKARSYEPKSTVGGAEIAFSFSTVKLGLICAPVNFAVRLLGNERTVVLYCRSEEHTSELQSLMRFSYAVFCLKKKIRNTNDLTPAPLHIPHDLSNALAPLCAIRTAQAVCGTDTRQNPQPAR